MNIWQDSNNAMNNSIPNSSTASEKLISKEILDKYSDYMSKQEANTLLNHVTVRERGKRSKLSIFEDYTELPKSEWRKYKKNKNSDEDSKGNS